MKNDQLVQTIQRLFAADDKPPDITPAALLLTIRLLVQGADERATNLSQGTLAEQLRCSESLIYATTKILKKHEWIAVQSGKNKSLPNRMQVTLDKLPLSSELQRTIVSDEMKQMALNYKTALLKIKPNRRFARATTQNFGFRLQWMLEHRCAGDAELLRNVINFAFASPRVSMCPMKTTPFAKGWTNNSGQSSSGGSGHAGIQNGANYCIGDVMTVDPTLGENATPSIAPSELSIRVTQQPDSSEHLRGWP